MATSVSVQVNTAAHKPSGTVNPVVYATIDTSGSMSGSKIDQVCSSLREIISKAPDHVIFVVRRFDSSVKTLVAMKKVSNGRQLDVDRLETELKKNLGPSTSLYDAWAETILQMDRKGESIC